LDVGKSVFLDRDGVINEDSPDYIKSWNEFRFLPGSLSGIAELTRHGFSVFVVSNQSAVNRKLMTRHTLEEMHARMRTAVEAAGGRILDIFYCPHRPDEGCACRKPEPGLLFTARGKYRIDLSRSVMVGDSAKDIECARRAGCALAVLVRTGNGSLAQRALAEKGLSPDHVADDLADASRWIIARWE
jgi:D-glycero-D-manno-heptose 1,7-bisphosphate phosphatase